MLRFEPQPVAGQQHHGNSKFPLMLVADGEALLLHARSADVVQLAIRRISNQELLRMLLLNVDCMPELMY